MPSQSYTSADLRRALVDAMGALHDAVIKDLSEPDPTPQKIERLLDAACAGWELGFDGRYTSESEAEWCGYTVAAAARRVGDYLEPDRCVDVALRRPIAVYCMGSTARLAQPGWWQKADAPQPETVRPVEVERGDIVVVGRGQPNGDHITIATDTPADGKIPTVEGNGRGTLGDQTQGEGVVVRTRSFDSVYAVYRLDSRHFEGADL